MSRISRFVVLVTALVSLFAVFSSTAGAVTWTNDGSTNFTATGGIGTLSVTGTGGSVIINCSAAGTATGDAPRHSAANTYTAAGTIIFGTCFAAGSPATIDCGYTLTATTLVGTIVTGNADFTCGLYISGTKLCHIEGTAHAQYVNPHPGPNGTFAVTASDKVTSTGASCPAVGEGHLTPLSFQTTSASPPTITRIA